MSEARRDGKPEVGRVEAFSDGVIAIIVTIMVLELHAPEKPGLAQLLPLWPTALAYAISFFYIAVYWVNHHQLFSYATRVSNALVWLNIGLLFALSLVPFATAYLGTQHFSRDGTFLYMLAMLFPTIFYVPLQHVIRATGAQGPEASEYHTRTIRKGTIAMLIYLAGLGLSFVSAWLSIACAALVAILWFLPDSPFDALFD